MTLQTLRVNYHFVTDRFGYSSLDQFLRLQKKLSKKSQITRSLLHRFGALDFLSSSKDESIPSLSHT
jgi:hypothetical protein